ncbi:MAG: GGDEF domain-containing protein [Polyangiaceae bacterium]
MESGSGRRPGIPRTLKADSDVSSEVMRRVKAPHRPVLVVMSGNEADVGRRVIVDRTLIVGRDPDVALCLTDGLVSWQHARLEDRGDGWAVVDLGSTNGVLLNGQRVEDAAVNPGDTLVFGSAVVRFELQDGAAQAYNQVVDRLLNTDDLSGLLVRRKFDMDFAQMVDAARARGENAALLVMDLDGVKAINDTHGHLFGAYVIGEAGKVIGELIRGHGIACRFGGDEYLAALPGKDAAGAAELAEQIRQRIAAHPFQREGIALRPGISIGVAAFPSSGSTAPELFQRADEALYRAKQAGKNRVSH